MSVVTEEQVREALKVVQDPDLHRDIVSLGFVQDVTICEGNVAFKIELTTPACPVKDQLKAQAEAAVRALPGVEQVRVEMTAQVRSDRAAKPMIPGVRHVLAVASGKGGVGKSTVSANLAVALAQTGARVGLLDADIYGPSLPRMMGVTREPLVRKVDGEAKMVPIAAHGVQVMSLGFILRDDQAVVWRGPMLGKAVADMLSGVIWGEQDYLLVDLPPGTGDVPMSLAQLVPISGVAVVTTPQQVAQDIARKSVLMFQNLEKGMNKRIPILGMIENMSGGIFGTGGGEQASKRFGVPFLGRIPLDEAITIGGDLGQPALLTAPHSEQAQAFQAIARTIAARISVLQYESEQAE